MQVGSLPSGTMIPKRNLSHKPDFVSVSGENVGIADNDDAFPAVVDGVACPQDDVGIEHIEADPSFKIDRTHRDHLVLHPDGRLDDPRVNSYAVAIDIHTHKMALLVIKICFPALLNG